MENGNVWSSEDLSLFPDVCASSPNIKTTLNHASCNNNERENKRLSTFTQSPQNVNRFSHAFKNGLRRNVDSKVSREAHAVNPNNAKKWLKISVQKLKLMDRKKTRTGPISLKSTKILLPPKKEHQQVAYKNHETDLKEVPLIHEPDDKRHTSNERASQIVEIEVFMPIIDSENNKIFYPKPEKSVIKRYFLKRNNSPRSNELCLKNKYFSKNVLEVNENKLLVKSTKVSKERSSKSLNKSGNKANAANRARNSLAERKSSVIDLKCQRSSDLKKRKNITEFKESTVDIENMSGSNSDVINGDIQGASITDPLNVLLSKDTTENQINSYVSESFKILNHPKKNTDLKFHFKKPHSGNAICSRGATLTKENMYFLEKSKDFCSRVNKNCSPLETELIPFNISGADFISNNKISNRERNNAIIKNDSNSSVNKKLNRNKMEENGRRRSIYSHSKGNNFSINKWRKQLENDDGLSIETWLDRCQYLQNRGKF